MLNPLQMAHGSGAIYATCTYLAIGLSIFPWLDASLLLRRAKWRAIQMDGLAIIGATLAMIVGVFYGVNLLTRHFKTYVTYVLIAFFGALGFFILFNMLSMLLRVGRDRDRLRKSQQATSINRGSIAADFRQLQTSWYRMKYVVWLRDNQVQPRGSWPNGRPSMGDEASTLLAQLDERWLGLEE
jgi:hypothetical protein